MFKKIALLAAGALALASPALAADLYQPPQASYAPAQYAPQSSDTWTGFYVGGNAGAHFGETNGMRSGATTQTGLPAPDDAANTTLFSRNSNKNGFIGGAQAGYNFQIDQFVLGGEADINYLGRRSRVGLSAGLTADTLLGDYRWDGIATQRNDWLSTFRLRAGYLATPQFLIYGTAGLAVGDVRSSVTGSYTSSTLPFGTETIIGQNDRTKLGYAVGVGAEYEITPSITVRGEYLYSNLGRERISFLSANSFGSTSSRVDAHAVRAGVNYRFGTW